MKHWHWDTRDPKKQGRKQIYKFHNTEWLTVQVPPSSYKTQWYWRDCTPKRPHQSVRWKRMLCLLKCFPGTANISMLLLSINQQYERAGGSTGFKPVYERKWPQGMKFSCTLRTFPDFTVFGQEDLSDCLLLQPYNFLVCLLTLKNLLSSGSYCQEKNPKHIWYSSRQGRQRTLIK